MRIKTTISIIAVTIAGQISAFSNWAYLDNYPWVYLVDEASWFYIPPAQEVFNASSQSWEANPFYAQAFDLEATLSKPTQEIVLMENETQLARFAFNFPGLENGLFEQNNKVLSAEYTSLIDSTRGEAVYQLILMDGTDFYDFVTLVLKFSDANGGRYEMLGNLGRSSCKTCTFRGRFKLQPVILLEWD